MQLNIEEQKEEVELFHIDEGGAITIEKRKTSLYSFWDDQEIDLTQPYQVEGLAIVQGVNKIVLETEAQLKYFQDLVKVNVKGQNNDKQTSNKQSSPT